jgi:hypothetical protein
MDWPIELHYTRSCFIHFVSFSLGILHSASLDCLRLIYDVSLDLGRPHNRLGFAYQVAFVRLFNSFPQQQPFELFEEVVYFSAAQLGLDAGLIELYRKRQPTISEHQQTIAGYLRLRPFGDAEVT